MVLLDFECVIVYPLCLRQEHFADKFANLTLPDPHRENAKFDIISALKFQKSNLIKFIQISNFLQILRKFGNSSQIWIEFCLRDVKFTKGFL